MCITIHETSHPYYRALKEFFATDLLHGMAHITGCGIEGNLCRILPEGLHAAIDLSKLRIPPIFKYIRNIGSISDSEMLRTFNCGVGFIVVVSAKHRDHVIRYVRSYYDCYEIGSIINADHNPPSDYAVTFHNRLNWL